MQGWKEGQGKADGCFFFANAAGGKELPVVIGKAAKPRCFKGIRDPKKPAAIPYYSSPKAWMTTNIIESVLTDLNRQMVRQGRKILLLLDNVSSHDPSLKEKFSNIRVVFLPTNTSRLQPLDARIIKNFKVHYCRLLLQHTLAQIDGTDLTASRIVKSVNVLMATRWIKQAWKEVKPQTITNCFKTCGAFPQELESNEDPFSGLGEDDPFMVSDDHHATLQELVDQLGSETTAQEYISADDDLCTCMTFEDSSRWREELRSMVCDESPSSAKQPLLDDDDSGNEEEPEAESSTITTYDEALRISNDLLLFLTQHSEEHLSGMVFKVITELESIKLNWLMRFKQSSITQFLL